MSTLDHLKETTPEFFKAHADNLAALKMLDNTLLGQGYIIMTGANAIQPELIPHTEGRWLLSSARPCPIVKAQRFNQETAEALAAGIKNGHGTQARAVHIKDALSEAIENHESLIKELALI
jgi:hypothetical protein